MTLRTALLTAAALIAFAANSILCRLALGAGEADAASFTVIRLVCGAAALAVLAIRRPWTAGSTGSFASAAALFLYAAPFSFAYLELGASMGALILFAAVQATMLGVGIARGERPGFVVWAGFVLAIAGLVGLTAPGVSAPDPAGAAAMLVAGIAWGIYSLRGRTEAGDPRVVTAGNFLRTLPMAAALTAAASMFTGLHVSVRGAALAAASGALASGAGYAIWYAALRGMSASRAAVLQLLVPVIAAVAAVALLGERVTPRLVLAGSAILGGVALAIRGRTKVVRALD